MEVLEQVKYQMDDLRGGKGQQAQHLSGVGGREVVGAHIFYGVICKQNKARQTADVVHGQGRP